MILWPLLFYTVWFVLLSFPLITQFNRAFIMPAGDGQQMVWDLWWVRYSILTLHQSPLYTQYLQYPHGTSLLLHTLMPFNGLLSIPLTRFFTEIQAFNTLVIFAFASSGLTAFWLCWKVTRAYWPSLAGGFAFAFCAYRWAHTFGHLNLISTEMLPLFLMGLLILASSPRLVIAFATAILLLIVLLIDQYQFLYCCLASVIVLLLWGWRLRALEQRASLRTKVLCFSLFFATAALLCGPIVVAMQHRAAESPILNPHNPEYYSADLLGPFVPDWAWLYGNSTRYLWNSPTASYEEKSVCLGPAVVIAALCGLFPWRRRSDLECGSVPLFAILAVAFMILGFGPTWRFCTIPLTSFTPYRAMSVLLPTLRLAGCPARMLIMTQLAVSVLAAVGFTKLRAVESRAQQVLLITIFAIAMVIESQPRVLLTIAPDVPRWVEILRDDPGKGAVIDLVEGGSSPDLFYQTVHHRPIALGDISRVSADTARASDLVIDAANRGDDDLLAKEGFGFIVDRSSAPPLKLPLIYSDRRVRVFRLPANPR